MYVHTYANVKTYRSRNVSPIAVRKGSAVNHTFSVRAACPVARGLVIELPCSMCVRKVGACSAMRYGDAIEQDNGKQGWIILKGTMLDD
jgi:hypothetical protein